MLTDSSNCIGPFGGKPSAFQAPLPRIPRSSKTRNGTVPMTQTDRWGIPFGSGLHRAVLENRVHQVSLLVSFGMNVDKRDAAGRSPVMLAAWVDSDWISLRILRTMIRANADLNMRDRSGRSLLSHACLRGRAALVRRLLREDTVERNCPDVNGDSPLNLAAASGFVDVVVTLVTALKRDGLNADTRNRQGCTALLLATQNGHYRCAQILLDDGRASLSSRDNEHFMNPTEWARHSHHENQRAINQRCSTVFAGRGDIQQFIITDKQQLPRLATAPARKHPPPCRSVARAIADIAALREQQNSLMDLIDAFEIKESNEESDAAAAAAAQPPRKTLTRTMSSVTDTGTDVLSEDTETCLLEDPQMSTVPISLQLADIFNLYEQQLFIRRPQPAGPETAEPDVQLELEAKKPSRAAARKQSAINGNLAPGRKKSLIQ